MSRTNSQPTYGDADLRVFLDPLEMDLMENFWNKGKMSEYQILAIMDSPYKSVVKALEKLTHYHILTKTTHSTKEGEAHFYEPNLDKAKLVLIARTAINAKEGPMTESEAREYRERLIEKAIRSGECPF